MKTQQKKELHMKDADELVKMLADAREKLFGLTMDKMEFKLKNVKSVTMLRKEIAQIASVLHGKEQTNG